MKAVAVSRFSAGWPRHLMYDGKTGFYEGLQTAFETIRSPRRFTQLYEAHSHLSIIIPPLDSPTVNYYVLNALLARMGQ
jgi:hypothetical protein